MQCRNRVVQRGISVPLAVFKTSNGRGWGIQALSDLPRGSFVGTYVGEVLTDSEAEQRKPNDLYFLQVEPNETDSKINLPSEDDLARTLHNGLTRADWEEPLVIDSMKFGNVMRFANHSCEPNLLIVNVLSDYADERLPSAAFFTVRDVKKGEELTWDYNYEVGIPGHLLNSQPCLCKSARCRGVMM